MLGGALQDAQDEAQPRSDVDGAPGPAFAAAAAAVAHAVARRRVPALAEVAGDDLAPASTNTHKPIKGKTR